LYPNNKKGDIIMKIKDIMKVAVEEGIVVDPRGKEEIARILEDRKKQYEKLEGVEKEIFDTHSLESPYADSRIIWGDPENDVNQAWVGIDIDTSEALLVKKITENTDKKPVIIGHHPMGRAYSNFYEVMDMQADILEGVGVTMSIADTLTRKRKAEVARRVAPSNHFKVQDAVRILGINTMNTHTPADNHVKNYLDGLFEKEKPRKLKDMVDILLNVEEYKISAKNGTPPQILTGNGNNKCGKIFVDMTGGTEGASEILKDVVKGGVSTVVAMHMSEKHFDMAKESNLNVIIAGHIASDNVGMNLLLDKIIAQLGAIEIVEFSGFNRVERNG
jgi:hypothetical protein